jgi:hypothetical protein
LINVQQRQAVGQAVDQRGGDMCGFARLLLDRRGNLALLVRIRADRPGDQKQQRRQRRQKEGPGAVIVRPRMRLLSRRRGSGAQRPAAPHDEGCKADGEDKKECEKTGH